MSGLNQETLAKVLASLEATHWELNDFSQAHKGHKGNVHNGVHYAVIIVSPLFRDKARLLRHRLVYQAFAPYLKKEIHALVLHLFTPEEWRNKAKDQ